MLIDIGFLIALIIGPILILIMAITQRWQWSLLPLSIFLVFWIIWFIMDTTVPFLVMDKIYWFILALSLIIASAGIGLFIRWKNVKKCDPKIKECEIF